MAGQGWIIRRLNVQVDLPPHYALLPSLLGETTRRTNIQRCLIAPCTPFTLPLSIANASSTRRSLVNVSRDRRSIQAITSHIYCASCTANYAQGARQTFTWLTSSICLSARTNHKSQESLNTAHKSPDVLWTLKQLVICFTTMQWTHWLRILNCINL